MALILYTISSANNKVQFKVYLWFLMLILKQILCNWFKKHKLITKLMFQVFFFLVPIKQFKNCKNLFIILKFDIIKSLLHYSLVIQQNPYFHFLLTFALHPTQFHRFFFFFNRTLWRTNNTFKLIHNFDYFIIFVQFTLIFIYFSEKIVFYLISIIKMIVNKQYLPNMNIELCYFG